MNTPITADTLLRDACAQEKVVAYWEAEAARHKARANGYMGFFATEHYNMLMANVSRGRAAAERMLTDAINFKAS